MKSTSLLLMIPQCGRIDSKLIEMGEKKRMGTGLGSGVAYYWKMTESLRKAGGSELSAKHKDRETCSLGARK